MAWAAALAVLLSVAAGSASAQPRSFNGRDNRVYVTPTEMPWSAIGKLLFPTGGHCSGALVSPRVVLTAAHCMFNQRGYYDAPTDFIAGYHKGGGLARSPIKSFWVARGYDITRFNESTDIDGKDYAFILLERPIGQDVGWFHIHDLKPSEIGQAADGFWRAVTQAGYNADTAEELMANIGCPVVGFFDGNTLGHRCDMLQGASGSPLFLEEAGVYAIVGVASLIDDGPGAVNVAVDSRAFADDLRRYLARYDP